MKDLDTTYQNLPKSYSCDNCGNDIEVPKHCGHPMHLEELEGEIEWVCWMGKSCGHQKFEGCDDTSIRIYPEINP